MSFSIMPEGILVYTIELEINLHEFSPKYPKNPKTFGELLRKKRMDKRLTMKGIARKLGVTETTVYNWEIKNKRPYRRTMQELKPMLGLTKKDIPI